MDATDFSAAEPDRLGQPLRLRARLASAAIMLFVALQLLFGAFIASMPTQEEVDMMSDAEFTAFQATADLIPDEVTITVIEFGLKFFAGVLFWMWMYRAYENLHALDREPEHESTRVVWCWFVPFANFVWPYQMMAEIWRKSDAHLDDISADSDELVTHTPTLVALWWGAWVGERVMSICTGRMDDDAYLGVYGLNIIAIAVSGALAVAMITQITARQEAALRRGGATSTPTTF